jgi:hypothetical protein
VSGGSGSDPYYSKEKPKKEYVKPLDIEKLGRPKYGVPIKEVKLDPGLAKQAFSKYRSKKVYWYRCGNCGTLFPYKQKKYTPTVQCSRDCKNEAQIPQMRGRKHSPDSIRRMKKSALESWRKPKTRENRLRGIRNRRPPAHRKPSKGRREYEYTCSHCGREFKTHRKKELENKYCSRKCTTDSQRRGRWSKCDNPECNNPVYIPQSSENQQYHYCSRGCMRTDPALREQQSRMKKGELNPNWGGGGYAGNTSWDKKSEEIRGRDKDKCQACGAEWAPGDSTYHAHHMVTRAEGGPDEDWNLVTLCPQCHPRIDAQRGFFKVPLDKEGNPTIDPAEVRNNWYNYVFGEPT